MKVSITLKNGAEIPLQGSKGSAGYDVKALTLKTAYAGDQKLGDNILREGKKIFQKDGKIQIGPFHRVMFGTGISTSDIPEGYEIQVRSRSGLSLKSGLIVCNTPGTVDSDYKGEIGVILINLNPIPIVIEKGDRIAQLVGNKIEPMDWEVEGVVVPQEFLVEERGEGGFGSTDKEEE
jgi:dUTP pyrophosphatase